MGRKTASYRRSRSVKRRGRKGISRKSRTEKRRWGGGDIQPLNPERNPQRSQVNYYIEYGNWKDLLEYLSRQSESDTEEFLNNFSKDHELPLNVAIRKNNLGIIKMLFKYGAKYVKEIDSPLKKAIAGRNERIIEFLKQNGASMDDKLEYYDESKRIYVNGSYHDFQHYVLSLPS